MADQQDPPPLEATAPRVVDRGGLRFEATFRTPAGATLRVFGNIEGQVTELLRFDDFVEEPHYHVPAAGDPRPFDRAALGEPLTWYICQLRDHLCELLAEAGFAGVVPELDLVAVTDHAEDVRQAMEDCVPAGFVRVPGVGLRLSPA